MTPDIDVEVCAQIVRELIEENGEQVFSVGLTLNSLASGSGPEVYKWRDYYWTRLDEVPFYGPFDKLAEALSDGYRPYGLGALTMATDSIWCSEMSTTKLVAALPIWPDGHGETGGRPNKKLTINGKPFLLSAEGKLRRFRVSGVR